MIVKNKKRKSLSALLASAMKKTMNSKAITFLLAVVMFVSLAQIWMYRDVVEAGPADAWDLNNFVTGVIVRNKNNVVMGPTSDFVVGDTYSFSITFSERPGLLFAHRTGTGKMEYTLPDGILVHNDLLNKEIKVANGATIGWYNIYTDGRVEVWFGAVDNEGKPLLDEEGNPLLDEAGKLLYTKDDGVTAATNFLDLYKDVEFSLDINAALAEADSGDTLSFGAGHTVQINIAQPTTGLNVNKTRTSRDENGIIRYIDYSVTMTATGTEVSNIVLNDYPSIGGNTSISLASAAAYKDFQYKVTNGTTTKVAATPIPTGWISWTSGSDGEDATERRTHFTVDFSSLTLDVGDVVTVTYSLDVKELVEIEPSREPLSYSFGMGNYVAITSTAPKSVHSAQSQTVSKSFNLRKEGTQSGSTINWVANIGDYTSPSALSLNGRVITDTLSNPTGGNDSAFVLPALSGITVKMYDSTGLITTASASSLSGFVRDSNKSFTFTIPSGLGDVKQVVIEYATTGMTSLAAGDDNRTYRNTIEIGSLSTYHNIIVQAPPAPPSYIERNATKTYNRVGTQSSITWTSVITSFANATDSLNGQVITDTLSAGLSFPADTAISIALYREPTVDSSNQYTFTGSPTSLIGTYSADTFGTNFAIVGNEFTFTVPPESGGYGKICRVVITYDTAIPSDPTHGESSVTYRNRIGVGGYSTTPEPEITITPPVPVKPSVAKESSHIINIGTGTESKLGVKYTLTLTVPANNAIQPVAGSNYPNYPGFYLRDQLTVAGSGTVNINNATPTDLRIEFENGDPFPVELYTLAPAANGSANSFDIYFGSSTATSLTSAWPYNDATKLVITYTIPLNLTETGTGENPRTIQSLLEGNSARYLQNTLSVVNDPRGGDSASAYDAWAVHKWGTVNSADETVFDFVVTLNALAGSSNANKRIDLFEEDEPAIFIDEFSHLLKYVPKSFYVTANGVYYGPYTYVGDGTSQQSRIISGVYVEEDLIKVEDGRITVDLAELNRVAWSQSIQSSSVSSTDAVENWYANNYTFEIHYQLKLKNVQEIDDGQTFSNSVSIMSTTQIPFDNDVTVTYNHQPLHKQFLTDGSNIAVAVITINQHGIELVPDGAAVKGRFTATDMMSSNLSIYMTTIKFEILDLNGNVVSVQPVSTVAGSLWSINVIDPHNIEFILPDKTPIRITYSVLITPENVGSSTTLENRIEVFGYSNVERRQGYQVISTIANASASRETLTLLKRDVYSDERLAGAEFQLYVAYLPSYGYYDIGTAPEPLKVTGRDGADYDFYALQSKTTAANGEVVFDSPWLTSSYSFLYLLVETRAPDGGYPLLTGGEEYTFFAFPLGLSSSQLTSLEAIFGPINGNTTDHIIITNGIPPAPGTGMLTLTKTTAGSGSSTTKTFAFTAVFSEPVTFRGVDYAAEEEITFTLRHGQTAYFLNIPVAPAAPEGTDYTITEASYSSEGYSSNHPGNKVTGTVTEAHSVGVVEESFINRYSPPGNPPDEPPDEPPDQPPGGGGGGNPDPDPTDPDPTPPHTPGGRDRYIPPMPLIPGNNLEFDEELGVWWEFDEDGTPLGYWDWNDEGEEWEYFEWEIPLGDLPQTGYADMTDLYFVLIGSSAIALIAISIRSYIGIKAAKQKKPQSGSHRQQGR